MRYLFVLAFVFSFLSVTALDQNEKSIIFEQDSITGVYQGKLTCESALTVGTFQTCSFTLNNGTGSLKNETIFLTGGMPAHQHGLPTMPKVKWDKKINAYQVDGLKFSMPGKWILNFRINSSEVSEQDEIKFSINVN